jgi:eukaryotic-like serine/threonine-protein kinase
MSATPAEDIGIGSVLRDTYELISVLGKGGMGKVFLARHLRLPGKQVAVKVLHTHEEITPDQYARFRREAEITSRLGHPNIVGVLDFYGQEGGAPCLVMEHLKGESLSQRIRRGSLPLDEVLSIARQVGSALHAAHQVGVIHRDLKPGNIFLVPTEVGGEVTQQVKLLDFGISKIVSSQTMQTVDDVLMGTPQYMSPEQAMGHNSTVDARSDLFALGSIVYEMLAGQSPFEDEVMMRILYRIVQEPLIPLAPRCPGIPAHVCATVERALEKKPEDRFPSVAAFIEELTGSPLRTLSDAQKQGALEVPVVSSRRGSQGTGQVSPPPTVAARGTPSRPPEPSAPAAPATNNRRKVAVAASLVALGGMAVAFGLLRGGPPSPAVAEQPSPPVVIARTPEPTPSAPAPKPVPEPTAATPPPVAKPAENTAAAAPTPESTQTPPPEVAAATPAKLATRPVVRAEVLPDVVRQALKEAEAALASGQAPKAIQLAKLSQRTQISGASYSVLARAYCQRGDISNARANLSNVPKDERSKVVQYCKRYDITF